MKAIETWYKGPTDTRGARIYASDGDGNKVSISYPYQLSGEACHFEAARTLCHKMKWKGSLLAGGTKRGYIFVWAETTPKWRV